MQPATDHCAVMHQSNNLQAMPTAQLLSSRTTFCICGDNIDKSTKPRYMRYGRNKANSIHYFHSYAVADRINVSNLSETAPPLPNVSAEQLAISLLPSVEDDIAIRNNFATLVARALVNHMDFFKFTFDGVVDWHITHEFTTEMSKKSESVSIHCPICCLLSVSSIKCLFS